MDYYTRMLKKQENFTLLDGRVKMVHTKYNPTSDAVWLASYVSQEPKTVLDVGIGTGGVSLCLLSHYPNTKITGLDISKEMLDSCKENLKLNNANIKLLNQDILTWSTTERFDLVITNPPYFNGTPAKHNAHHNADLKSWIKHCCARVAPKGIFCTIVDALCADKVIAVLNDCKFGDIHIFPLFSTKNTAERILIKAKAASKTGMTFYCGTSMNNEAILREGLTIVTLLSTLASRKQHD